MTTTTMERTDLDAQVGVAYCSEFGPGDGWRVTTEDPEIASRVGSWLEWDDRFGMFVSALYPSALYSTSQQVHKDLAALKEFLRTRPDVTADSDEFARRMWVAASEAGRCLTCGHKTEVAQPCWRVDCLNYGRPRPLAADCCGDPGSSVGWGTGGVGLVQKGVSGT